jgi:hypothetical protein
VHTGFWWENLGEGDHLEDGGVDEKIILKSIFENCDWGGGGHGMDRSRNRWRALVNEVMNFWFHKMWEIF